jgi:nucleoside-diphosphate-sugar epimerase
MRQDKIFITGAAGFVGANIVHQLISDGYDVHIAVRNGGSLWRLDDVLSKITVHEGILTDKKKLSAVLEKINPMGIFHLAAYGSYPKQTDRDLMILTNITGLNNLLEASQNIPYRRFVVSGSSSEYGKKIRPMGETDLPEPNNMYAVTKLAAANLAQYFGRTFHKPVNVFRLFNVYGYYEEEGRLVRTVIESASKNEPVKLATGKEARDFIFTGDVARGFIRLLKVSQPLEGEIFNLGTGVQTTVKSLVKKILKITKSRSEIILNAYTGRSWDTNHWCADTRKTADLLDFRSAVTLDEGLKMTVEWYRERNGR